MPALKKPGAAKSAAKSPRKSRKADTKTAAKSGAKRAGSSRGRGSGRGGGRRRGSRAQEPAWRRRLTAIRRDLHAYGPYVLGCGLTLGVLAIYGFWAFGGPGWAVRQAETATRAAAEAAGIDLNDAVVANRVYTPLDQLKAAVDLGRGDPLLHLDLDELRARIRAIPWVKDAEVRRTLSGVVQVYLTEETPFALWQNGGSLALVNDEGRVITRQDLERFADLPHVVGEGAAGRAGALLALLEKGPVSRDDLKAAVWVGDRRWDLHLRSGVRIRLPDRDAEGALATLAELDAEHDLLARDLEVIDLRLPDRLVLMPYGEGGSPGPEERET